MQFTDPFNIVKRSQSLTHAIRGIVVYAKTTPNFWFHFAFALVLVVLGVFLNISSLEWLLLVFANMVVLVAEAFNSAIEIDIDLTSPEYHPFARDTKDVAAGAVLLTGIAAWVVDIFIFAPKILAFFN